MPFGRSRLNMNWSCDCSTWQGFTFVSDDATLRLVINNEADDVSTFGGH